MADKNGTIKDVRNSLFENIPAVAISPCPFKGPEVAIIPVRYALDQNRRLDPDSFSPRAAWSHNVHSRWLEQKPAVGPKK